ncbi:MAG: cation transporter, partial [Chthoniobacterales bacterium]
MDLAIEGMTCAACAARVEKVLNRIPGVSANVNFATEKARINYDPASADLERLTAAVRKAGYGAHRVEPANRENARAKRRDDYRAELGQFIAALVLALPFMAQMVTMLVGGHY